VVGAAGLIGVAQAQDQEGMVAGLDADDVPDAGLGQVTQMRRVGAESVFDDDDEPVGMVAAKVL
jgi:hypothetical protein